MKEVIKERQGLYRQEFEHDNCGIGAVANIKGIKTHKTVDQALHNRGAFVTGGCSYCFSSIFQIHIQQTGKECTT